MAEIQWKRGDSTWHIAKKYFSEMNVQCMCSMLYFVQIKIQTLKGFSKLLACLITFIIKNWCAYGIFTHFYHKKNKEIFSINSVSSSSLKIHSHLYTLVSYVFKKLTKFSYRYWFFVFVFPKIGHYFGPTISMRFDLFVVRNLKISTFYKMANKHKDIAIQSSIFRERVSIEYHVR